MNDGAFLVDRYKNDPIRYCVEILNYEPDKWQADDLRATLTNKRGAVASGHGVGKTRLVASKIHWFLSTRPHPQVVVTANTKTQLDTKTWRELAKINQNAVNKDLFDMSASRFWLKDQPQTWFASAIPWTEHKSEAFSGTHEEHVLYVFDEASSIPNIIWEVSEGAMTTAGSMFWAYGNPTRNTGKFAECFGRFKHRWFNMQVDSRTAKMADQTQIKQWIEDYGEDSDFVRVRVRGVFPRAGTNQFISSEDVDACKGYKSHGYESHAVIFGIDVARFGDDQNVVCIRQGRKVLPLLKWRDIDTMQTASKIIELSKEYDPDILFIDGGGVGGGVIDRVKQLMQPTKIREINFGSTPNNPEKYYNKRAEMWGIARDNIKSGIEIPNDIELINDLIAVEYGFTNKQQIQLERKEDMKKRGLSSPDCGDAFSLTFAEPVLKTRANAKIPQEPCYASYDEAHSWMS